MLFPKLYEFQIFIDGILQLIALLSYSFPEQEGDHKTFSSLPHRQNPVADGKKTQCPKIRVRVIQVLPNGKNWFPFYEMKARPSGEYTREEK